MNEALRQPNVGAQANRSNFNFNIYKMTNIKLTLSLLFAFDIFEFYIRIFSDQQRFSRIGQI